MTKRKLWSTLLVVAGYILSPLSWWNDLFINLPLAYVGGSLFGLLSPKLFAPFLIITYWLTNVLGLFLLHLGGEGLLKKSQDRQYKKTLWKHIAVSAVYTIIVTILIRLNYLKFPTEYLK